MKVFLINQYNFNLQYANQLIEDVEESYMTQTLVEKGLENPISTVLSANKNF